MSVGKRLKKERERLGLNQTQMGVIGNVKKQSQLKYENDVTSPTANYLIEVAKIGVNVHYVLFGAKADNALTEDEQQLLAAFRAAPPVMR